jgi:hypothetical protein
MNDIVEFKGNDENLPDRIDKSKSDLPFDPANFSLDDLKKIDDSEFYIYIQQFNNTQNRITVVKLYNMIKQQIREPFLNANWSTIQREFRKDKDLERRINLIKDVLHEKRIKISRDSETFNKLIELDRQLDIIEATNLDDAKEIFESCTSADYIEFKENVFEPMLLKITDIYNEIYGICLERDSKRHEISQAHEINLKTIEKLAKYKIPMKFDNFQSSVNKSMKDIQERILTGDSEELKKRELNAEEQEE